MSSEAPDSKIDAAVEKVPVIGLAIKSEDKEKGEVTVTITSQKAGFIKVNSAGSTQGSRADGKTIEVTAGQEIDLTFSTQGFQSSETGSVDVTYYPTKEATRSFTVGEGIEDRASIAFKGDESDPEF